MPIGKALFSELSHWDAETGLSVPTLVLEISPIAPERVANQSILETETGPREDGGVSSTFTN